MKLALATTTEEVEASVPVALLSGSFQERLGKAAAYGYDGVELMVVQPERLDVDLIRKQVEGLEVAAVASGAIPMVEGLTLLAERRAVSEQAERRLARLIDIAQQLGAPLVTIGGFRGRLAWSGGLDGRGELVSKLRRAAEYAERHGVRLVIEPLNRYETDLVTNAAEGLALLEEVGHSHLGLLLDTFHVNIEEDSITRPFQEAWEAGRLWHVHIGDSNRLPPGQGHFDFPRLIEVLDDLGYRGFLSAELLARPDPDAAAKATLQYLRRYVRKS